MKSKQHFDFWYAVNNTEIIQMPVRHLETFGATTLNYHLITEMMDAPGQIHVREGRMKASRPQIITPEAYSRTFLEGFGEEASKYVDWIKKHEKEVHILQYGYRLAQESFSENIISDKLPAVVERVKVDVKARNDPLGAVVVGVEEPWDVCLVKLFWEVVQHSAKTNIRQMVQRGLFEDAGGLPRGVRAEIEKEFLAASRDASHVAALHKKLQFYGVFDEYEDRFFALVREHKKP